MVQSARSLAVVALTLLLGACAEKSADNAHEHGAHEHGAKAPADPKSYTETPPSKDYPLKTCVVSGDALGSMGDPVAILYQGREVQFCCEGCIDDFLADPKPHLSKLDAAKR